jgi:2'-5' RNA ligase
MQGILSLVDPESAERVNEIFGELSEHLGLHGTDAFPYPHISFCFLDGYTQATVEERLQDTVSRFKPFHVKTAGIGIFLKPNPVLFAAVVRSTALDRLHRLITKAFPPLQGDAGFYTSDHWMPHITLAVGDLTPDLLPEAVRLLASRDFHWEITLDNLTFASETEDGLVIQCTCKFIG